MVAENRPLNEEGGGRGGAGGHGPPLFLKPYFARNVFLEICFCVILQGIQNFFLAPAFPKSCQGPWKSFKFMVLRLLKETFVSRKIESFHFCSFPQVKRSPRQKEITHFTRTVFSENLFPPQAERGEDYGAEKMTKIKLVIVLVTSIDKFHHLCSLYMFDFCFVVS